MLTKIFIINLILILSAIIIDVVFDKPLEGFFGTRILNEWVGATITSVPVYLIYLTIVS